MLLVLFEAFIEHRKIKYNILKQDDNTNTKHKMSNIKHQTVILATLFLSSDLWWLQSFPNKFDLVTISLPSGIQAYLKLSSICTLQIDTMPVVMCGKRNISIIISFLEKFLKCPIFLYSKLVIYLSLLVVVISFWSHKNIMAMYKILEQEVVTPVNSQNFILCRFFKNTNISLLIGLLW